MTTDQTIPILPSQNLAATLQFYRQLGFEGDVHSADAHYAILCRGAVELHFFAHPELDPKACYAGCYLRVADVRAWYQAFVGAALPTSGIPRLDHLSAKPWGMLEFAVVDPNGNLLRIGQELESAE